MKRSTYWMLSTIYIYAQLLGILNFCYNCRTGRAHIKPYITAYSAIISLTMFGVLTYFLLNMEIKNHPAGSAELHYKLNLLTSIIRVVGVILTVFYNWTRRRESVQLINTYQQFCRRFLKKWQVEERFMQYLEHGIRVKLKRSFIADVLVYVIIYQHLGVIFDMENSYILLALALIPTVLNVVMTLYYFAILNINILMTIINEEIKRILNIICETETGNCVKYCHLADQLDDLAVAQGILKTFLKRINKIYNVQAICVVLDLYVNNIFVIYIFAMLSNHLDIWAYYGDWVVYFVPVALFIWYLDIQLFIYVMLNTVDLMEKTGELLKGRPIWTSNLNDRLERSLDNFSLQLAQFPLEFDLVGLFNMNRPMAFATFSSTISNAIVLIQYDLKYTKKN
ncbi:putative gustatory receptor 59d [Lucilia cuprina]|uniref:Gustatory receptor n=1 Tax=Lucilia cuprina TaxID=7375 RepID=A0A0L0CN72_LUCCU|nr:putative gustatory receptor 59d [Lucilia cuprina]KNC33667.1 putative gustatory receptor 59d [Lucilia cuprina]